MQKNLNVLKKINFKLNFVLKFNKNIKTLENCIHVNKKKLQQN